MPGSFYAVHKGHRPGVYTDWPSAEAQVKGFPGNVHQKFHTREEAEAFVLYGPDHSCGAPPAPAPLPSVRTGATTSLDCGDGTRKAVRATLLRAAFDAHGGPEAVLAWADAAEADGRLSEVAAAWVHLTVAETTRGY